MQAHMQEILNNAFGIAEIALTKTLTDIFKPAPPKLPWGANLKGAAAQPLRDALNKATDKQPIVFI